MDVSSSPKGSAPLRWHLFVSNPEHAVLSDPMPSYDVEPSHALHPVHMDILMNPVHNATSCLL